MLTTKTIHFELTPLPTLELRSGHNPVGQLCAGRILNPYDLGALASWAAVRAALMYVIYRPFQAKKLPKDAEGDGEVESDFDDYEEAEKSDGKGDGNQVLHFVV